MKEFGVFFMLSGYLEKIFNLNENLEKIFTI